MAVPIPYRMRVIHRSTGRYGTVVHPWRKLPNDFLSVIFDGLKKREVVLANQINEVEMYQAALNPEKCRTCAFSGHVGRFQGDGGCERFGPNHWKCISQGRLHSVFYQYVFGPYRWPVKPFPDCQTDNTPCY